MVAYPVPLQQQSGHTTTIRNRPPYRTPLRDTVTTLSPYSPGQDVRCTPLPWDDNYDILRAIQHLLAALTQSPNTNQQTLDAQEPNNHMQPRAVSPETTKDQRGEQEQKRSNRTATPLRLPSPRDLYARLASTLAQPMDAEQYYKHVLQQITATDATLRGWTQVKGGDNEWGSKEDLLREDTYGTLDTFLEAAATAYPCPPGDTQHSLHALLAFHSWKHHHAVTLHPLDHNPQRWTPEDNANTTITIQQDPKPKTGYHLTWSDPAPHPPTSPTLHDIFPAISAGLQEAKSPQQPDD